MMTPTKRSSPDHGITDALSELERLYDEGDKQKLLDVIRTLLSSALGQVDQLSDRVAELLRQLYGRKHESINPQQLTMALLEQAASDESSTVASEPLAAPAAEELPDNAPARQPVKKTKHGRNKLPAHLPREEVRITPTEEQLATTSGEMKLVGEERSAVIDYEPAQFKVIEYVREVWSNELGEIVTAPPAPKVIDKGLPGPGLLTQIVIAKYRDHQPLNRQVRIYLRSGVSFSRNTLADWIAAAADLVEPVAKRIFSHAMQSYVLQVDDTSLKVLDRRKAKNVKRGRIWALVGDHRYAAYRYTENWRSDQVAAFLGERSGWMQVDGYKGYARIFALGRATEVGCWMHARRFFVRAFDRNDTRAAFPLQLIKDMYRVEAVSKELGESYAERLIRRKRDTAKLIETLRDWIAERHGREPPASLLGKALTYADNHWKALIQPLEDGALELDNGDVERALRGTAMGRRNWLFAGSDEGAKRAAILATVIETAARHDVDVWTYFRDLIVKLAGGWPQSRLDELLPERWQALHAPA